MTSQTQVADLRVQIPIQKVRPNPYQPESRCAVNEETARKFAVSIQTYGLLQIPLGRPIGNTGEVEMGDGWLRLSGYRWLAEHCPEDSRWQSIPVELRNLSDREMADLVMEANTIRKDLTPIELARFYKRYLEDFKISQGELARLHNVSQGEIANTIRLLELPEPIQKKIISQEITETHGRQLLRMNAAPALQEKVANECIKENFTVNQLSDTVERTLWQKSVSLNPKGPNYESPPIFDLTPCQTCPERIQASDPWSSRKKEDRCLNEECWSIKQEAVIKARIVDEEAKAKKSKSKFVDLAKLQYDQYKRLTENELEAIDNPEECASCESRVMAKHSNYTGKAEPICLKPSCFRTKQGKRTRDKHKIEKIEDAQLTEELAKFFSTASHNLSGCLQVLARHLLPRLSADGKADLGKSETVPVSKLGNGRSDIHLLRAQLKILSTDQLLELCVASVMIGQRRHDCYGSFSTKLPKDLELDMAIISGTADKLLADEIAFQEANCRNCWHSAQNKQLIGTGENCCDSGRRRRVVDGKCESFAAPVGGKEPDPEEDGDEDDIED